jgi:capsular polysaccharide biosynthesis protein
MDNNTFFNSVELIRLLNRWKKHLIIVGLISLVASVIFSSPAFIQPKFKSTAVVYPSNLIAYSTESATEQMLQIAQSSDIRDRVIRSFRLLEHYDIDSARNKSYLSTVIRKYEENINIKKTEYESMEITVMDKDPLVAARIADSIIHFFNIKARALQAEKSREVMIISKNQLDQKKLEMDSMENLLHEYSIQYGLLDFKSQSREVTRAYLRGLSSSNAKAFNETKTLFQELKDKGTLFNSVSEHLWRVRGTYNDLKLIYENAERDVYKKLTYTNVVTRPQPSDRKAYPIRWLIVTIAVGSSLLVAFMVLLVINSRRRFEKPAVAPN